MVDPESEPAPDAISIPIVWVGIEELPPLATNQMVVQHTAPDEFTLTFGHLATPVALGTDEQRREQLEQISFIAIKPLARVAFNRQRLEELITVLQQNLERHDRTYGSEEE